MSPVVQEGRRANYNDRLADYVDVKERIKLFYERHPDGRLVTAEVRVTDEPDGVDRVWAKALAYRTPDDPLPGAGWSWLILPGSTPYTRGSEIENAETSAWGRAIGSLGIGIEKSIASGDEIRNKEGEAERQETRQERTNDGGLIGTVAAVGTQDFELRQNEEHGWALPFRLVSGTHKLIVVAYGSLAEALHPHRSELIGKRATCWGEIKSESFPKNGKTISYPVLHLERIATSEWTLPFARPIGDEDLTNPPAPVEAPSAPMFGAEDMADLDAAVGAGTG